MVFTTEGFFEVAIESWPEWDFNPRRLSDAWHTQCSTVKPCRSKVGVLSM